MNRSHSFVAIAAGAVVASTALSQTTLRVTVSTSGVQANAETLDRAPMLSADGRYVAYSTLASNLVPGDTNGASDVFVHDLLARTTERVSVGAGGQQANGGSVTPALSRDGRFVVFASGATNLVAGDVNAKTDVFLFDRRLGTSELVSVSTTGAQGSQASFPSWDSYADVSADGSVVVFESIAPNLVTGDTNNNADIFVRDRVAGTTERANVSSLGVQANAASYVPTVSFDGRFVAFSTDASTLVPGDTNGDFDVFVRDRSLATTERVSLDVSGAQSTGWSDYPRISGDGRLVAFLSGAADLVPGDTNGKVDAFVRDRWLGANERVSVDSAGVQSSADVYSVTISAAGRFASFATDAPNLVSGDTNARSDVFLRDRVLSVTQRVSLASNGAQVVGDSFFSSTSLDGQVVAFVSDAENLVSGDTNGLYDAFVRVLQGCAPVVTYCTAKPNSAGCSPSISSLGVPSASSGSGFVVRAEQVLAGQLGLLFYGADGPNELAFQGGRMCVRGPLQRTTPQLANPGGAPPCDGLYAFDLNAYVASGVDPRLLAGTQLWCQYWMRDGSAASGTGLSDALTFVLCD